MKKYFKKNKLGKKVNKQFNFAKFLPTFLSLLAVCCGVTAIKSAFEQNFYLSVSLILFDCFLDGIDGRVARFFQVSSAFGAEIDSLADLVNFGVAPGFVLYCYTKDSILATNLDKISWFAVMLLVCCMAIRLARFNVDRVTKNHDDPLVKYFFVGMPAPAVAAMSIWPIVLNFEFGPIGFWNCPTYIIIDTIILALFAGSKIPTPCFKKIKIPNNIKGFIQIVFNMYVVLLFIKPWLALSILGLSYILSIIIGLFVNLNFRKNRKNDTVKN